MAFTPFPPRQPTASARLPLTLMTLDDWALATITGADSEKYMQGQVTADVSQMAEDQHLLAAHCDAKGKMWSNLRLLRLSVEWVSYNLLFVAASSGKESDLLIRIGTFFLLVGKLQI